MGHGSRALHASAQAALDRRITGWSLGDSIEFIAGGQLRRRLTAEGQRQAVLLPKAGHNSSHQQHRFTHHQAGG